MLISLISNNLFLMTWFNKLRVEILCCICVAMVNYAWHIFLSEKCKYYDYELTIPAQETEVVISFDFKYVCSVLYCALMTPMKSQWCNIRHLSFKLSFIFSEHWGKLMTQIDDWCYINGAIAHICHLYFFHFSRHWEKCYLMTVHTWRKKNLGCTGPASFSAIFSKLLTLLPPPFVSNR